MILVIDNFDSFTYNVVQVIMKLSQEEVKVVQNDSIKVSDINTLRPSHIILSSGPGRPEHTGICKSIVLQYAGQTPILGVCLGHQVIGYAFGARIVKAEKIVHGKTESIHHDGKGLFRSLPKTFQATRYHSLIIKNDSLPNEFEISAFTEQKEIMGIRHKKYILEGVQFHPESIASEFGTQILRQFLSYRRHGYSFPLLLNQFMTGEKANTSHLKLFMQELLEGTLSPIQISAIISGIGIYPSVDVLITMASVLREQAVAFQWHNPLIDTCGTGGDGLSTYNISSLTALMSACCGQSVAKHGNRAVSSQSGSADLYQSLGIAINLSPEKARILLKQTNFTFLFAPRYHTGMRHVASVRKTFAVKTIFNLLGPLANPTAITGHLLGVFDKKLLIPMAQASQKLGVQRVLAVHGGGMDEISISTPTEVVYIDEHAKFTQFTIDPREYEMPLYPIEAIQETDPKQNVLYARKFIQGNAPDALRDIVLLNTAAALFVAGKYDTIKEGLSYVKSCYENGILQTHFEKILRTSQQLAREDDDIQQT